MKATSLKCFEKIYSSLGYCIFCLRNDVPLNKEHIIPASIRGSYIFHGATCKECEQTMNSLFETKTLQNDLLVPRLLLNLKKSTSKMPLVAEGDVDTLSKDNSVFNVQLEADEYPPIFNMLVIPKPGLLSKVDQSNGLPHLQIAVRTVSLPMRNKSFGKTYTVREPKILGPLQLSIAKMAFCYALAEYGEEYFDAKDIRDLILGKREDVFQFVGGYKGRITDKRYLHKMYFQQESEYLTVIVHLFASSNGPPYQVVVGKIK